MKKIAIVGSNSGHYFGIGKNYHNFISSLEGAPIIISPEMNEEQIKALASSVDLLILPGGADLSASLYGAKPSVYNTNPDLMKEHFFRTGLKHFVNAKTPIFGICLGFQMLNVYFGGTLTQHLFNTDLHQKDVRFSEAHKVKHFSKNLRFGQELAFGVNSHHHQAVKQKNLANSMIPVTFSDEWDKTCTTGDSKSLIIESFIHETLPIAGVQWHPEEWYDNHTYGLIQEVLKRSQNHKKQIV